MLGSTDQEIQSLCSSSETSTYLRRALNCFPPPPTENTDLKLHDIVHRIRAKQSVYSNDDYHTVVRHHGHIRPSSPDHLWERHQVSKRTWENHMQCWRHKLHALAELIHEAKRSRKSLAELHNLSPEM